MKYCNACKARVANPLEHCPLCYATLNAIGEEPEMDSYPDYHGAAKRYNLILRILLMLSVAAAVICLTINLLVSKSFLWSLLVIANIAYCWLAISTALRKRYSAGFKLLAQVFYLGALLVVIDQMTDTNVNWAYDYALPLLFCSAILTMTIVCLARRLRLREFILYFILIALLGFIPLILLGVGVMQTSWPAIVSAVYGGLSLISLFVFADSATRMELKKRFHI